MPTFKPNHLVAVLANPPLTSGARTLSRLTLANSLLGYDSYEVVNLFGVASRSTSDIRSLGVEQGPWTSARDEMLSALERAGAVLLGYGCQEPGGPARYHHRAQVHWLHSTLNDLYLGHWRVGNLPTHPSRWQRHTAKHYPELAFPKALVAALEFSPSPASS